MVRFTGILFAVLALGAPVAAQQATPDPAQRIPMTEFKKLQADNNVLVIDVRDQQSYELGHIPGARSIPLGSLLEPARVAELKAHHQANRSLLCLSGGTHERPWGAHAERRGHQEPRASRRLERLGLRRWQPWPPAHTDRR